jgi:hypothetical protein
MTVKEIVAEYLKSNGYDGLCNEICGCGLEDFMPCGDSENHICEIHGCEPAYRIELGSPECVDWACEEIQCDGMAYCYKPNKTKNLTPSDEGYDERFIENMKAMFAYKMFLAPESEGK